MSGRDKIKAELIKCNNSLTEYTCAIGEIVQPKNILYASRISNNRVCLYLASKELVDSLTDKLKHVKIGDTEISIRPLVTKQKRVVLSNVAPPIPQYILDDTIDSLNIKRSSPVSILRANINKEGYGHILSSRRLVYIDPDDAEKLPEFIKIIFEQITYFIYPSTDVLKCFLCKMEGHIARHCSKNFDNDLSTISPLDNNKNPSSTLIDGDDSSTKINTTQTENIIQASVNNNQSHTNTDTSNLSNNSNLDIIGKSQPCRHLQLQ